MLATAIVLCGVLVAACSPERIPGSTVDQGDAGVSFLRTGTSASGAIASSSSSSSSYGSGGSSGSSSGSSTSGSAGGGNPSQSGGKSCAWYSGSGSSGSSDVGPGPAAPPGWDHGQGLGRDNWYDKNCRGSGSSGSR